MVYLVPEHARHVRFAKGRALLRKKLGVEEGVLSGSTRDELLALAHCRLHAQTEARPCGSEVSLQSAREGLFRDDLHARSRLIQLILVVSDLVLPRRQHGVQHGMLARGEHAMLDKECRCCPGVLKLLLQRLRTLLALCCVLWLVSISWGTGIQADARCFPQVRVQRVELCLLHVKLHMRCHVSRSMTFQSMLEVLCTRCAHWSHWYYGRGQGTHLIENVFRHFVISMSAVIITHTSY